MTAIAAAVLATTSSKLTEIANRQPVNQLADQVRCRIDQADDAEAAGVEAGIVGQCGAEIAQPDDDHRPVVGRSDRTADLQPEVADVVPTRVCRRSRDKTDPCAAAPIDPAASANAPLRTVSIPVSASWFSTRRYTGRRAIVASGILARTSVEIAEDATVPLAQVGARTVSKGAVLSLSKGRARALSGVGGGHATPRSTALLSPSCFPLGACEGCTNTSGPQRRAQAVGINRQKSC